MNGTTCQNQVFILVDNVKVRDNSYLDAFTPLPHPQGDSDISMADEM